MLFPLNAVDAIFFLGSLGLLKVSLPEQTSKWGQDLRQALNPLPDWIGGTALFPGLAMTLVVQGLSL